MNGTDKEDSLKFQTYCNHDMTLLMILDFFNIELEYEYSNYASIHFIELFHDDQNKDCTKDECFYLKIFVNLKELKTELPFYDLKTKKCSYSAFKKYL